MELIARPREINFLNRHKNHHIIKVISGVRRCGKSCLMQSISEELSHS
ncbi:MAG TPA: ATPase, partial [Lachnospiraceae bacterium]|nr:ATPase [Lachnospiraceae bacterium]